MGQDWYSFDCCGEATSDYHDDFKMCECGRTWCSFECSDEDGFIRYDDEFEGEVPTDPKHGWELESSCKYCRKEDFSDDELLYFAIEELGTTRDTLIKMYKDKRMDD